MNNDSNDDRDNDSTTERTPSSSESDTFRKEPTFTLFDNDTELEIDDIEAEDFASDYATEGYDDKPFDDDEYTDETDASAADDEATPVDGPVGGLWVDDDNPEFDEPPAEQSERTPWDDEPVAPESELAPDYTEDESEDDQLEHEIDDDDDDDDYGHNEYVEEPQKLPIGLIIVALVALALLAAGGYGVIKERATAQAELTELRARLATAVEQQDIEIERDRARSLESENSRLLAQVDALTNDNATLSGQVDSLQQQLEQASASVTAAPAVVKASPLAARPSTPSSNSAATPANSTATGNWFVNFGSYSQRVKAQEWADRLKPDGGTVIVAAADSTGGSIYRVRIIGLGSKADAQRIAAQLERTHNLTKLWVGQQ